MTTSAVILNTRRRESGLEEHVLTFYSGDFVVDRCHLLVTDDVVDLLERQYTARIRAWTCISTSAELADAIGSVTAGIFQRERPPVPCDVCIDEYGSHRTWREIGGCSRVEYELTALPHDDLAWIDPSSPEQIKPHVDLGKVCVASNVRSQRRGLFIPCS